MKLLQALKAKYPQLSQKQMRELIKNKQVFLGKKVARITDFVQEPESLLIPSAFESGALKPNPELKLTLLKEDAHFIFILKPAFCHSVAQSFADTDTVANALVHLYPELAHIHPLECGLAHRLDYETSGVMVAAKSKESYDFLRTAFTESKIKKIYAARLSQNINLGLYQAYVVPGNKSATKTRLSLEAHSSKQVMTHVLSATPQNGDWLVKINLLTGFRHQIRAHLAFLGFPLKGDTLYGSPFEPPFFLHAESLEFDFNGVHYFVESVLT